MVLPIAVAYLSPKPTEQSIVLAKQLLLPLVAIEQKAQFAAILMYVDDKLQLQLPQYPQFKPLWVDLLAGKVAHRCRYGGGRQQILARAMGLHKVIPLSIMDVTAGLGIDAYVLASLGATVTMIERNPIIAALLSDGMKRAQSHIEMSQLHLQLIICDAKYYLDNLTPSQYPQVIYLDPMFPDKKNSALAKKEMRMIRNIVGGDDDAAQLLTIALQKAQQRVVVKRPRLAELIPGPQPSFNILGKSSRFDIYLTGQSAYL